MTYEDFKYWYAENTEADYDDICKKVLEVWDNGWDEGYAEGCAHPLVDN